MSDTMSEKSLDYEAAKRMVRSDDPSVRRTLAAHPNAWPELLYYLATDKRPEVRREISNNPATPRQADLLLVNDQDVTVRSNLALKIARIAPDLPPERQDQIERMTLDILESLARDQATEVRAILSEQLKCEPNAPSRIIGMLARDVEMSVCGPVLRNSPILSEEDLLEIVFGGPPGGALAAIAERHPVPPMLSDAIADSQDVNAVTVLLKNSSAQIREETLDRIIERAPAHEVWHEPLVRRPHLPPRAAARLACFVADSLLQALRTRTDLGPMASRQIADVVRNRLISQSGQEDGATEPSARAGSSEPSSAKPAAEEEVKAQESPVNKARRLKKDGKLDEAVITNALTDGDRVFALAALAELAGTSVTNVDRVLASHSARGVTALVWRAGLTMRLARQVQLRLAQIPPNKVLNPAHGTDYPMNERDLRWQLEFFGIS